MYQQWHVSAFLASADTVVSNEIVETVRELRARVLFDRGRRPAFRGEDGRHVDDQDLDYGAWHFVARKEPGGPPLGYIRLSTPATGELFQSRAFLGDAGFERILREAGCHARRNV